MKKGFSLIELLVASMLLGILVSVLTTVFSQSSIAWSTGTASVVDLDDSRRDVAELQVAADAILDSEGLAIQSVFKDMTGQNVNDRAVVRDMSDNAMFSNVKSCMKQPSNWSGISVGGATGEKRRAGMGDGKGYVVGVTSYGPDGIKDTWDDITTWPAE